MAKVPNIVEALPKISTGIVGARALETTDRQTDGWATGYSEREREFTFSNKCNRLDNRILCELHVHQ